MSELHSFDVIVLGAGAAGLLCAFTAAKRGRRVLVLEKSNKVGKKILMSGGGRCNFTNQIIDADNYISANAHFCKSALSRYSQWDFISMVGAHDIAFEERKHSQLFCLDSARDILDMLLKECDIAGVEIKTHCEAQRLEAKGSAYTLEVYQGKGGGKELSFECASLVVATGALSIPTLGGSGLGYDIAQQFGLKLTQRRAGLVPFMFSDNFKLVCERLAGVSQEVTVSCKGQSFTENMLFTHRGLSGPAILQISNYWSPGDDISIDLLPSINVEDTLLEAKVSHGKSLLRTFLNQFLGKSLVKELESLWWANSSETALTGFSDKQLIDIADKFNNWLLRPSGTEGYRTAEVTLGGVDTDGISSQTMEAKNQSGLFFIGEVLDVSGHLGGFNFQWAWSSGYAAGIFV